MKILIDMNLSPAWVETLGSNGHEAAHWSTVGDPRAPDSAILEWARSRSWVVLTHDLDFGAILAATGGSAPSVVQLRVQDLLSPTLEELVLSALETCAPQLATGALIVIDAYSRRVRLLPLADEP